MIRNTFSILNGIGEKLEKKLWRHGILTWDDFINTPELNFISHDKKTIFNKHFLSACHELDSANAEYFAATVKRREHWRLYDVFKGDVVCLDIETNGFMPEKGGYATVVGLYDGYDYRCLLRGNGLTPQNLMKELSGYKCLITFYGVSFDIPFLLRAMPGIRFDIPHFDLCFGARRLGFKGGLKRLEDEIGIQRNESVKGMNGYDAVRLWEHVRNGSTEALNLLVTYNREDTIHLFRIAKVIYQRLKEQTGIEEYL